MALITCPECSKEVSDQALTCPHCGFPMDKGNTNNKKKVEQKNKIVKEEKPKRKLNPIPIVIAIVFLVLLGAIYYFIFAPKDPFTKVKYGISREDEHKRLGEPDESDDRRDVYYNVSFAGLNGELVLMYGMNPDKTLQSGWNYQFTTESDEEAEEKIQEIVKYYDKKYGEHKMVFDGENYSWTDDNVQIIVDTSFMDENDSMPEIGRLLTVYKTVN